MKLTALQVLLLAFSVGIVTFASTCLVAAVSAAIRSVQAAPSNRRVAR